MKEDFLAEITRIRTRGVKSYTHLFILFRLYSLFSSSFFSASNATEQRLHTQARMNNCTNQRSTQILISFYQICLHVSFTSLSLSHMNCRSTSTRVAKLCCVGTRFGPEGGVYPVVELTKQRLYFQL